MNQPSLNRAVQIRGDLARQYDDVYSDTALDTIAALAELNEPRLDLMRRRIARRAERARERRRIDFLPAGATIAGTDLTVADARAGRFTGSAIPGDLQRQWIQGTGPGAKPDAPLPRSIRNVAYALLSGADGWMFDGEDALGQVTTMSLDNQRNLHLGIARAPEFLAAAEGVAGEMNAWAEGFLERPIIGDWRAQLDFTTTIFRARGLHLDDRHVRMADGTGLSASIVDRPVPSAMRTWRSAPACRPRSSTPRCTLRPTTRHCARAAPRSSSTCRRSRLRRRRPSGTVCSWRWRAT